MQTDDGAVRAAQAREAIDILRDKRRQAMEAYEQAVRDYEHMEDVKASWFARIDVLSEEIESLRVWL